MRRDRKSSLELRVAGKIRSVLLYDASFSGKCPLKFCPATGLGPWRQAGEGLRKTKTQIKSLCLESGTKM